MIWQQLEEAILDRLFGTPIADDHFSADERKFYAQQGQRDFIFHTGVYRGSWPLTIGASTRSIAMPTSTDGDYECLRAHRVTYNSEDIDTKTSKWVMNKFGRDWQSHTGANLLAVFQDRLGPIYLEVYPLLTSQISATLYGAKRPPLITDYDSAIVIPEPFDLALVEYVCDWAFRKDHEHKDLEKADAHRKEYEKLRTQATEWVMAGFK